MRKKKTKKRKTAPRRKAAPKKKKGIVTLIEHSRKGKHIHEYRNEATAKRAVKFMRKNNLIPATYTITKEL
jgi:hypothetical protein